ncbi:coiled-coil domain-containing protein 50-like isoform X3 [Oncorhynchus kisutch]|uniref:Coiled-coil domain-containing protein 50-like n=1 Tax=Oncorhynchus kisutch TaxID=8019 RepID=A0A8C7KGP3_ONCKI|nr:coiled-coil domain-containing protein 50-like isoform X3 [Oncorhynchus kisutch]XP_020315254.1 coiled-coil domain-containing protein 50-like isoform X3 [Oncorhynchus kisutch]
MTELEIDQSHLPRVQEVCHVFAVLEDGALAHNLQEQEIEQYYTTNMQKNQLVQNDIRIAKRLQNEEEEQRAQHRALLSQASRQLQEEDSEYARMIQEEILRCADEEAQRREQEDEEMAKRIQEEEGLRVRQRSGQESLSDGAALQPEKGACLDLGELQQVLLDEELARRLQEEEKLLRRSPPARPSHYQRDSYPVGDFRVAQVAQDEEIARFMQKQEMKSKRRSRDLDGPGSQREPHDLADPYDRRTARERRIQRERLGSDDLPSPAEDCSPDYQAPRPTTQSQQPIRIRNIAEELDPTFKASRQGKEGIRAGPTISGTSSCQSHPTPHSGLHDFMEEPTFIPPTKRQSDKSVRAKSKEKKENCKQQ